MIVELRQRLSSSEGKDEESTKDSEAALKCDACKIIARKFANAFKTAESEVGERRLKEDEYIEAAEGTCDEDWTGYGVRVVDGVQRLAGEDSEVALDSNTEVDPIWERRLQDFCDELLVEFPDEKTVYNLWSRDGTALQDHMCKGEGMFKACVEEQQFGPWPGDEYDDYDDIDFDYPHDEF